MDRRSDPKAVLRAALTRSLPWDEKYSVGNDRLDTDHVFIFNVIERFKNAVRLELEDDYVNLLFSQILEHAGSHFGAEERYMEEIGYPGLENHRRRHGEMMAELKRLRGRCETPRADRQETLIDLVSFLNNWWLRHIMENDMDYKAYAQGRPLSCAATPPAGGK